MVASLVCACTDHGDWASNGSDCTSLAITQEGAASTAAPALVSFNFRVADGCTKRPTSVDSFQFFEDGAPVSQFEAAAAQAQRNTAYVSETLLLIDLSGSITSSNTLPALKEKARAFADTVLAIPSSKLAVHAFDGQATTHPLVDFTSDAASVDQAIAAISCPDPTFCADTTTNLYGAVVEGVSLLKAQLAADASAGGSVVGGSLVVFTDGADRAQRASQGAALSAVGSTTAAVIAVGLKSPELNVPALQAIGREGYFEAADVAGLDGAFSSVIDVIRGEASSHYTASLCSDRRNDAVHTFGIKATKGAKTGEHQVQFSSKAFAGGCTLPSTP